MTLQLHHLLDAEVTGYDGDAYSLRLPGGIEVRDVRSGGPGPTDWEFFGVKPLDGHYLLFWHGLKRWLDGLKEKWAQSRTAAPSGILKRDATGLYHSDDYRVCRDREGNARNCSPVSAKLIETLNLALREGIPELNADTLFWEAMKLADSSLCKTLWQMHSSMVRLDHIFRRDGVWKTLVFPGVRKGCYRLIP
jgi:hypothetical protein